MKSVPAAREIKPKTGQDSISFLATKRTGRIESKRKMSRNEMWFEQIM